MRPAMNIKKMITIIVMVCLCILTIKILVYISEYDKPWESPYDESLITQNVVLDVKDDDVDTILQAVGDFLIEKGESNNLSQVQINTDIESLSDTRYYLIYDVEPIDIYTGFCWVYCSKIEDKWVIIEAKKEYDDTERKKKEPLNISDIEDLYEKNLEDLQKEDFYGGAICSQNITRKEVIIRIFGEEIDEHNFNVLIKEIKYNR